MQIFTSPKTDDTRKRMHELYGDSFVDATCLAEIVPTLSIKWSAFKHDQSGLDGVDYCFLEYAGFDTKLYCVTGSDRRSSMDSNTSNNTTTTTTTRQKIGYCISQSIERKEVPSLEHMYKLGRGSIRRTGLVVEPTARHNMVQITTVFQVDAGTLPYRFTRGHDSLASQTLMTSEGIIRQRLMTFLSNLPPLMERRRLSSMAFVEKWQWVPNSERKACVVCHKSFALRKKHHCRHCGEVVCSSCAPLREVDTLAIGIIKIRICTACVLKVRQTRVEQQQQPVEQQRTDSFGSSSRGSSSHRYSVASVASTKAYEALADHIVQVDSCTPRSISNQQPEVNDVMPVKMLELQKRLTMIQTRLDDNECLISEPEVDRASETSTMSAKSVDELMGEIQQLRQLAEDDATRPQLTHDMLEAQVGTVERQAKEYFSGKKGRKESYRAMVNELHEIMGLPGLQRDSVTSVEELRQSIADSVTSIEDNVKPQKGTYVKETVELINARVRRQSLDTVEEYRPLPGSNVPTPPSTTSIKKERAQSCSSEVSVESNLSSEEMERCRQAAEHFLVRESETEAKREKDLHKWLLEMREEAVPAHYHHALMTLVTILTNLLQFETESKYMVIKRSDHQYSQALSHVKSADEILKLAGYLALPQRFVLNPFDSIRIESLLQSLETELCRLKSSSSVSVSM